jgi:hypothetical protein
LYEGVQSQPDSLSSPGSHGWRVSQEPEPVVSNVKYNNTYGGIDTLCGTMVGVGCVTGFYPQ